MLALFPQLLFLAPFSALLIRIALAILFLYDGWHLLSHRSARGRAGGVCAIALGTLLFVGLWTQPASLAIAAAYGIFLIFPYPDRSFSSLPTSTIALAIVMALSLVFTGPGALAFDLPL